MFKTTASCFAALAFAAAAQAQVPQYGQNITLEQARRVAAAAEAEATKNRWPVAIAVVDTAGQLVYYQRADNTQTGSVQVAIDKAQTAAMFRRTTKAIEDGVAAGGVGLRLLRLGNASPIEGGVPVFVEGRIVGGLGVSGVTAAQDGQIANAGAGGLK